MQFDILGFWSMGEDFGVWTSHYTWLLWEKNKGWMGG